MYHAEFCASVRYLLRATPRQRTEKMKTGMNVSHLRRLLPRVELVKTLLHAQLGNGCNKLQGAVQRILRSPAFKLRQVV